MGACAHTEQIEAASLRSVRASCRHDEAYRRALQRRRTRLEPLNSDKVTARVSPNGRWLAFMSQRSLTGYDNHDANSGNLDEEVYLYDATGNGGKGSSCAHRATRQALVQWAFEYQTDGRRTSVGRRRPGMAAERVACGQRSWMDSIRNREGVYQSRYFSDSGRLFFNSRGPLVAQDSNGTQDVYEWEPAGVGSSVDPGKGFVVSSGGCVALISSGTSPVESAFLDASETGGDVFFLTASKLASQDIDSAMTSTTRMSARRSRRVGRRLRQ